MIEALSGRLNIQGYFILDEDTNSGSGKAGLIAAAVFFLGAIGVGGWMNWPVQPDMAVIEKPTEAAEHLQDSTSQEAGLPATQETLQPATPKLDEVRRADDGITIIAGQASPGADVQILKDGAEIATTTADSTGKFAAIAHIPADGEGHVLSLSQTVEGEVLAAQEEILLAPLAAPVKAAPEVTAAAAKETAPKPDPVSTPKNITDTAAILPQVGAVPAELPTTAPQTDGAPSPLPKKAAQVAVLRATSSGVALVEPIAPAPQVTSNIVLDTIGYSEIGDVELAGRAQDQAAEVRVYLNNKPVTNLSVDAAGNWRGTLPEVDEGVYTLRVDEVTETGAVSSRVETPFKRESAAALAAAGAGSSAMKAITVQQGATLWAIARDRYGDGLLYLRVFEANADAIRDPDLIYPGQVFTLPQ